MAINSEISWLLSLPDAYSPRRVNAIPEVEKAPEFVCRQFNVEELFKRRDKIIFHNFGLTLGRPGKPKSDTVIKSRLGDVEVHKSSHRGYELKVPTDNSYYNNYYLIINGRLIRHDIIHDKHYHEKLVYKRFYYQTKTLDLKYSIQLVGYDMKDRLVGTIVRDELKLYGLRYEIEYKLDTSYLNDLPWSINYKIIYRKEDNSEGAKMIDYNTFRQFVLYIQKKYVKQCAIVVIEVLNDYANVKLPLTPIFEGYLSDDPLVL
jgi:hypothetical protein